MAACLSALACVACYGLTDHPAEISKRALAEVHVVRNPAHLATARASNRRGWGKNEKKIHRSGFHVARTYWP
jgi:hypothetical protein